MDGFKRFLYGYSDHEIIGLYLSNQKISEIAIKTNKSYAEIYRILHNNNVHPNRLRTNHHHVVDFALGGMGINQIAELTGYSPRNIRYILNKLKMENG